MMSIKYIKICWRFRKSALQENADRERERVCVQLWIRAAPKHNEIRIFFTLLFFFVFCLKLSAVKSLNFSRPGGVLLQACVAQKPQMQHCITSLIF